MPLPTGQISFSQIAQELGVACQNVSLRTASSQFGLNQPDNISEMRGCSPGTIPTGPIEYVLVAGGGGGGLKYFWSAGGGGAGGYISSVSGECSGGNTNPFPKIEKGTYTLSVGAGGAATYPGNNSSIGRIVAIGGGEGWSDRTESSDNNNSGGSGGGGSIRDLAESPATLGGIGTTGQGFAGNTPNLRLIGGGGGGAGESPLDKNGGNGIQTQITGVSTYYAGGGGAGVEAYLSHGSTVPGEGGLGGGGMGTYAAARSPTIQGTPGCPNTGGGGGGSYGESNNNETCGWTTNGGSGVIIFRYPNTVSASIGAGLSATCVNCAVGSCKYTCIIGGTGNITFT